MQKVRRHQGKPRLRPLVGARFQVLFHSPPGVLFTFPSRYWFTIGQQVVLSLAGWSPRVPTGFPVPGRTQVPTRQSSGFRLRGCYPLWPAFPGRSTIERISHCPTALRHDHVGPTTPDELRPQAITLNSVWADPFSLATTQGVAVAFLSSGY